MKSDQMKIIKLMYIYLWFLFVFDVNIDLNKCTISLVIMKGLRRSVDNQTSVSLGVHK
jgi:hypothetical protein